MKQGRFDGHSGLDTEVQQEDTIGAFTTALAYTKEKDTGHFVIHAHSSRFDVSSKLDRNDFLEELGFRHFDSCNTLDSSDCYYYVLKSVERGSSPNIGGGTRPNRQYERFVEELEEMYEKYREVDNWIQDVGVDGSHR